MSDENSRLHLYTNRRPVTEGGKFKGGEFPGGQISWTNSRISPGFIDLATFDGAERFMYTSPILAEVGNQKKLYNTIKNSNFQKNINPLPIPFTMMPNKIELKLDFNNWTLSYVNNKDVNQAAWLSITFPEIKLKEYIDSEYKIRWTDNLMHNLFQKINCGRIEFDNFSLDLNHFFYTDENKKKSYEKMIGNNFKSSRIIPSMTFVLPLPFVHHYYHFQTRSVKDLLILEKSGSRSELILDMLEKEPHLEKVELFYNKICTQAETKINKKILFESLETYVSDDPQYVKLPFSGSISQIYILIRDKSKPLESSPYEPLEKMTSPIFNVLYPDNKDKEIKKDNNLPYDYFLSLEPYFNAKNIPDKDGVYMYSGLEKKQFQDSYIFITYKNGVDFKNLFVVVCAQKNI